MYVPYKRKKNTKYSYGINANVYANMHTYILYPTHKHTASVV